MLRKGDLAVDMMDVWGDNVEKVEMPSDGYCWFSPSAEETRRVVPERDTFRAYFTGNVEHDWKPRCSWQADPAGCSSQNDWGRDRKT